MSDWYVNLVRGEFDREALSRICRMHEVEFAGAYDMELTVDDYRKGEEFSDFHLFRDNGASILAVAHLDTVIDHSERMCDYAETADGPVVFSGALDDRLGAYTILELLPRLGVNVDVLLTTAEEPGCSTAQFFEPPKEYLWMIEFDRGGTDVVMYQYEDDECVRLVEDAGARVGDGSYSDIAYLDHLEIKGFNWGVGYRDYHGPRGHAFLADYWRMIGYFLRFHQDNSEIYLPHEQRSAVYTPRGGGLSGMSERPWWDDDWSRDRYASLFADDDCEDDEDDEPTEDFNLVNARLLALMEKAEESA